MSDIHNLSLKQAQELFDLQFEKVGEKVSGNRYEFVAEENNKEIVIQAAYEALQKTDPENANQGNAIKLAEKMQLFARQVTEKLDVESPSE